MKWTSVNIATAILLLSLFISGRSSGQIDLHQPLEAYLNSQSIKENGIRSLTVYADFNEDGIDRRGGEGGKLAEIEFDANGNQLYKVTSSNSGNLPFVNYGRGSTILIDSFDQKSRKLSAYIEDYGYSAQIVKEYDADGNSLRVTTILGKDTVTIVDLTWSMGKMIRSKTLYSNEINKNVVNDLNPDGKLTRHVSGDFRQDYEYDQQGDDLVTTVSTYKEGNLTYTETYSANISSGQITHYVRKDHLGLLEIEMKAKFDEFGNAVLYFLDDRTESDHGELSSPVTIVIENTYNSQQLLMKRLYFYSIPDVESNVLARIERYFYDTEPLPYKLGKGALMRHELMEENFNDE